MQSIVNYFLNRLGEKSTWVALGTLLTGFGVVIKPELWQQIMGVGMGIGGLVGVLLPARVQEQNVTPASAPTALSDAMQTKATDFANRIG